MAKVDKIKEIGWLKVIFSVLVATDISLLAWLAQNFNMGNILLFSFTLLGIIATTLLIVWINWNVYNKMDVLEEL